MTPTALALTLESTILAADASAARVEALCREAAALGFVGVCVPPCRVREASDWLAATPVGVVSVAGFPFGYSSARAKAAEVADLFELGAREVDLVLNVGWLLEGRLGAVAGELREARRAAGRGVLKVILETGYLSVPQQEAAAEIALEAGADFLKTSTGFGPSGARVADVALLHRVARGRAGVKASGGIRTWEQARGLLSAGADRLGTSAAGAILAEAKAALAREA